MDQNALSYLHNLLASVDEWKQSFGPFEQDSTLMVPEEKVQRVFGDLAERLNCNYPFHHPYYAGQMLKPPHPLAWAAYAAAMSINPNNHALDGGPPSSEMEKEAVQMMAAFFGYGDTCLGHLTSSGTIANLEALWVARQSHPGKAIAFSEQAHYTHSRMCEVLGVESTSVPVNENGMPEVESLAAGKVGTLVVTLGTTGLGKVEPLHKILAWAKKHGIRLHVDAAYGGFFHAIRYTELIDGAAWQVIHEADSMVVDPHKHGLQPYGCGCVLFKDPKVGRFYRHDSPYTYFTSEELHLGEISLECSRSGAAAVALWTTLQLFPLQEEEGFGPIMKKCRQAALNMYKLILQSKKLDALAEPELDIVGYFPIPDTKTLSEVSNLSKKVFNTGMKSREYYLSLYKVPAAEFCRLHPRYKPDQERVTILRSVLMRPEQAGFAEQLVRRIEQNL